MGSLGLAAELATLTPEHRTHYIAGSFAQPGGPLTDRVINPATGDVLTCVPSGGENEVDRAVAAARAALPAWAARTPQERAEALLLVAEALIPNAESLARLEALQVGKPLDVARGEIPLAADALRYFAGAVRAVQAPAPGAYVSGQFSLIHREPVGVVGAITPWNYPLMMAVWKIAPALAAGNTVVLKPSELTPLTSLRLAELTADLLPSGALNVVLGRGDRVGQAIASHPSIAMVSITGSVDSGKAVARSAVDSLKRVHLELGGKAPVVVFADADLEAVTDAIVMAGFWNSGQECGSATRVLVHKSVSDDLVGRLVQKTQSVVVGNPDEGEHIQMGPLICDLQRARVAGYVTRAVTEGAELLLGGEALDRPGSFYMPTILGDVREGSELDQHEVFGPVVSVQTFSDEADALRLANSTPYGLAASVWTKDSSRSIRLPMALDFGTVWVNSHLTLASELPWNGFGESGYGREMSTFALDDYSRTKHIMLAVQP